MWLQTKKGGLVNLDSLEYVYKTKGYSKESGIINAETRIGSSNIILGEYESEKDLDDAFEWLCEYLRKQGLLLYKEMQ